MWLSNWCEDNKKFSFLINQDIGFRYYTNIILDTAGLKYNKINLKKTTKGFFFFSSDIINILKLNSIQLPLLKHQKLQIVKNIKNKVINSKLLSNSSGGYVLNLSLKKPSWSTSKMFKNPFKTLNRVIFSEVSASVFSKFFSNQILLPLKLKDKKFKYGLQRGILTTLRLYFNKRNKLIISGIRVLISGKWTKTKNGRTQKVCITMGKLNNQKLNTFIDNDFQRIVTKFGACSVKVLISYKNTSHRY